MPGVGSGAVETACYHHANQCLSASGARAIGRDRREADVLAGAMRRDSGPAIGGRCGFRSKTRDKEAAVWRWRPNHVVGRQRGLWWPARREGTCLAAERPGHIVTFGVQARTSRHRIRAILSRRPTYLGQVRSVASSSRSRILRPAASYIKAGYLLEQRHFMFRAAVLLR